MKGKLTNTSDLGTAPIHKLILSYTSTSLITLLLGSLYNLGDALFVSWGVGAEALGGVSAVLPFTLLQSAIATMLGGGAATLVARHLGAGEKKNAARTAFNAMAAFYITALAVTALGLALREPLLALLGPMPELLPYARTYLTILLIGNVFSTGFSAVMRAEGKLRYATLQWVLPISLNTILDVLFVLVLKWGVAGSAWSTVIGQALSFAMAMFYFARVSELDFKGVKLHLRTAMDVLTTGLPSLIQQGAAALGMAILNHLLAGAGGAPAQTVFAFVSKIYVFAILPFTALTNGLSPVAAHNVGAQKPRRVKSAFGWACLFALGVAAVFAALCETLPGPLLRLFTSDAAVLSGGVPALRLLGASLPVMFLPMLAGVLFQAAGKKTASAALFASALVPVLPLALLGGRLWGVSGIWAAFPISGLLATVFAGGMVVWFMRKFN